MRAAIFVALMLIFPLGVALADSVPPQSTDVRPIAPPPAAAPVTHGPSIPKEVQGVPPAVRLAHLQRRERRLRRHIWRLRMRRRQFIAQGMPDHARHVHERIIELGWRLRRVQAAERALRGG